MFEWEETEFDLTNDGTTNLRGARGGDWLLSPEYLVATCRANGSSDGNYPAFGIRVASVPEPVWGVLGKLVLGGAVVLPIRRRMVNSADLSWQTPSAG